MGSLRALARLAARDARRDRWRSLLVVVLVALPVAALVAAVALLDAGVPTGQERAVQAMGAADLHATLVADWASDTDADAAAGLADDDPVTDLAGRLPVGAEVEPVAQMLVEADVAGRSWAVNASDHALGADALAAGVFELVDGRAPRAADEVALTPAFAERAGTPIGSRVALEGLGAPRVVGLARDPQRLSREHVLALPGALDPPPSMALVRLPDGAALPDDPAFVTPREPAGESALWRVMIRQEVEAERLTGAQRGALLVVGGLAAVEVALIAGASFGVSVRRRQRELGLLAATGGSPRHVRGVVLLTGATAGLVGAAVGTALGVAGVLAATPWLDRVFDRVVGVPAFDLRWVAGCALLGVSAAVLGAWLPARATSRLPVSVALSGRRPTPSPSRRALRVGLLLVVVGLVATLAGAHETVGARASLLTPGLFLLGAVTVVLGAGLTSPWLLERLGRLAPKLPTGPRLALRDAARFRTRNGPIVTAAMAALAGTITVSAMMHSEERHERDLYEPMLAENHLLVEGPGADAAAERLADELGTEAHALYPRHHWRIEIDGAFGRAGVASPALAEALGGPEAAEAVREGSAVFLGDEEVSEARLTQVEEDGAGGLRELGTTTIDAVAVTPAEGPATGWPLLPETLLPIESVEGLEADPDSARLLVLSAPIDDDLAAAAAATVTDVSPESRVLVEQGYQHSMRRLHVTVVAVGVLAGLMAVAVAVALTAAESRHDLRLLEAVGASMRTRRSLAAARALVLSGLGAWLAVPVGLLPAFALLSTATRALPFVVPWSAVALIAVAVPLVATVGAGLSALAGRQPPPGRPA